jgi:hypothetical protein
MATDVMNTANESALKVITFAQDTFLKAYKTIASRVPTPPTPSWLTPDPDKSREAIEKAFNFQAQLLEARKNFALGLVDAGSPAVEEEPKKPTTAKK